MKRCPECLFIYPDSDTRCDFDNTPLVVVDEAEIAAATTQAKTPAKQKRATKSKRATKKRQRKVTVITAVVGLLLGTAGFTIYHRFSSHPEHTAQAQATPIIGAQQTAASIPSPSPLATAPSLPTPTPTTKPTTERIATAHTSTTFAPVSTSGPGMGKKPGAKPTIILTSGARIDADEIWRTRDGVWYRRDGIVTLLKRGRVKAIVNE
jgi:hypothetical protein